jgi:DNA-binding transcriptional MerR regulator
VIRMDQSNSYFTISDLAKELDVKKSHIRFCEKNGFIPPRASKLKRRVYNRYDRERLKLVFHFVLLSYSKEQIIDLIGIPDANLDENDQLMQGIEYGLKELKKLEKRKEELSFTKQTRIINEIEMLREYINKIKIIKSGVFEETPARQSIRFEEKAKRPAKPVLAITAEAEKKATQHPAKVISLFVVGLALVILIGSYFYYQAGQKETKTIKLVQKKPIHSGKILVPQASEPVDQTAKTRVAVPEAQKISGSTSPAQLESVKAQSTDALLDVTKRNKEIQSESDTNFLKDEKPAEKQLGAGKTDTVSKGDPIQAGIVKETVPSKTSKEIPVTIGDALAPERQTLDIPKGEGAPKDDVQKEFAGEDLSEKTASTAVGEDTMTVAVPEPVKEKATDIEVKEAPEPESAANASPISDDVSLAPEKQTLAIPKVEGAPKDDVQKEFVGEDLSEKAGPAAVGEETLTAAVPEPRGKKAAETEVKPSLTQSEKEQITSEENINQQKNELNRLKSFLDEYCQAYTNKDLDKFITFFTSDAIENNKPFHELLPDYRKNMESRESLTYRIELMSYSKQTPSGNLLIRGRFFNRYQSREGVWKESNGSILMELLENGDSFLVKQLNYRD